MNVLLLEDRLAASTGKGVAYVYNRGIGNSTAGCSCGWIGRRRLLKAAAEQDAWSHCAYLTDVLTVSEDEIRSAVAELAFKARLVAEPSGAVALAAYRRHRMPAGPTVVIVSGGNIEPALLSEILTASAAVGKDQRD